jgi:glycosyltransferase involved in cell wall biosynthesis/GT2 family glycosyltransferase
MRPFCSVVVATHARPERLAACLDALARLDYPRDRYEVVVVDDGDCVDREALARRYRGRLDLRLVAQPRGGPAAARNAGAARARGELLAFTDDDCEPEPAWLSLLAERHAAEPGAGFGGLTVTALAGNPYSAVQQLVIDVGYARQNLGDTARFLTTNNLAVPADGFRALGGFDPAFTTAEDRDFCARWVESGRRLRFVPGAVVRHAHELDLLSFCRVHFAYGRGAFRFHRARAARIGEPMRVEPRYYAALARRALALPGTRRLAAAGLLLAWLAASTAGYAREARRAARAGRGSRGVDPCDVVHLVWAGPIGGIEQLTATLVREAAGRDDGLAHRVCYVAGGGVVGGPLVAEGLAVRALARAGWDPVGLWRLARLLRALRPAVVVSYTHALGANLVAAAALPRALRVYNEQSPRALGRDAKFRVLYRLLRATTARYVAPTPAMARDLEARGIARERIAVVPNPLRHSPGEPSRNGGRERPVVGVVARLEPQKRIDLLLDVVAELRRRGVDCAAVVVGGGSQLPALERRRNALGLGELVTFTGEATDVVPWLDRLDVFVSTSAAEPFGIASLEAMGRGVPVVAMPCPGGLAELVGRGGVLLPDRDPRTAADAVQRLLASPAERRAVRARAAGLLAEHAPALLLDALERLCAEAAAERFARRRETRADAVRAR